MGATFTIARGVFLMPDFSAKSKVGAGLDIKGLTEVTLSEGYPLKAKWELIDTYNVTRARDVSVQNAGIRVDNLFAEGNGPVRLPVTVGCKATSPCFTYTEVPEHFTRVALSKLSGAATKKVESEVKKKAESVVKDLGKKASPEVNKAIKKLFKF
jgi:hypothetical protein